MHMQRSLPVCAAGLTSLTAAFTEGYMLTSEETEAVAQQHLARLRSAQHSAPTAWLSIVSTKDSWEIDDETVKSALRFMLGVSAGPPDQGYFTYICGYRGDDSHHAMCCDKMSGFRTLRHNHVQNTVRYGCTVAGLDTCGSPRRCALRT
jgi:hypothetical protein